MYSICVYEKCSEFLICGGLQPSIHPACSDIHCAPLVDIPFTGMNGMGSGPSTKLHRESLEKRSGDR